nr:glycosyltransferase 61 family protein [Nitrospirillum iridis]
MDGSRIEASVFLRDQYFRAGRVWPSNCSSTFKFSGALPRRSGVFLYLSVLFPHWGHFCTESIARLWAYHVIKSENPTLVFAESHIGNLGEDSYVKEILELNGIDMSNVIAPREPVILEKVYVPEPTMRHIAEYYPNHMDVFHYATKSSGVKIPSRLDDTPIYLSRRKLASHYNMANFNRTYANESNLEEVLKDNGFVIVYPDELSVLDKIELFNKHKYITGPLASSFYGLSFSLHTDRQETHIFYNGPWVPWDLRGFFAADEVMAIKANYIGSGHYYCGNIIEQPDDGIGPDFALDIKSTTQWLDQCGLLKKSSTGYLAPKFNEAESTSQGNLIVSLVGGGSLRNEGRLSGGRRKGKWRISGFSLEGVEEGFVEYKVEFADRSMTGWLKAGAAIDSKDVAISGVAFRSNKEGVFLAYVCFFSNYKDPVWNSEGAMCRSPIPGELEAMQLYVIDRNDDSLEKSTMADMEHNLKLQVLESKINEIQQRTIHIENKIDRVLAVLRERFELDAVGVGGNVKP